MPFLKHFGLDDYPFRLVSDSKMFYPSPQAEAILQSLLYALNRGDGILKIVGEIGTGKTMLCRMLLERLGNKNTNVAYFCSAVTVDPRDIPEAVLREFGQTKKTEKAIVSLQNYLIKQYCNGKRNILVIDEAQTLGALGIETIRLLSNLETGSDKLLQIVMFGQPELDQMLHQPYMKQTLQRITFTFDTTPLSHDQVSSYINHRILACHKKKKGKKTHAQSISFTPSALWLIAMASAGVPRLINKIADKALMAAYAENDIQIKASHVRRACRETPALRFPFNVVRYLWA